MAPEIPVGYQTKYYYCVAVYVETISRVEDTKGHQRIIYGLELSLRVCVLLEHGEHCIVLQEKYLAVWEFMYSCGFLHVTSRRT